MKGIADTGLSVLVVLLAASSCLIARAMTRELAVARLQSDFVASVSHEFRSPLTSMRQLSSMLLQGPAIQTLGIGWSREAMLVKRV